MFSLWNSGKTTCPDAIIHYIMPSRMQATDPISLIFWCELVIRKSIWLKKRFRNLGNDVWSATGEVMVDLLTRWTYTDACLEIYRQKDLKRVYFLLRWESFEKLQLMLFVLGRPPFLVSESNAEHRTAHHCQCHHTLKKMMQQRNKHYESLTTKWKHQWWTVTVTEESEQLQYI